VNDLLQTRELANRELRMAVPFLSGDLEFNREGRLTEAQRFQLRTMHGGYGRNIEAMLWLPPFALAPMYMFSCVSLLRPDGISISELKETATHLAVPSLVLLAYVIWLAIHKFRSAAGNLANVRVHTYEGSVPHFSRMLGRSGLEFLYVDVDGTEVVATEAMCRAFEGGRSYRVHYVVVGGRGVILSAEQTFP
jgi:hypothetical protein